MESVDLKASSRGGSEQRGAVSRHILCRPDQSGYRHIHLYEIARVLLREFDDSWLLQE